MHNNESFYFIPMNDVNFNEFETIQIATGCNTCFPQLIPVQTSNVVNQLGAKQNIMASYLGLRWDFESSDYHNQMLAISGCVYCEDLPSANNFIQNGLL